jgi:hypothetical protein
MHQYHNENMINNDEIEEHWFTCKTLRMKICDNTNTDQETKEKSWIHKCKETLNVKNLIE